MIGAQKAGTTTLYSWLSQHPEIDAPEALKDFHFFSSEKYYPKGYEWFQKLYKNKKSEVRINGAVNYIFRPEMPAKIKEYNEHAKFIVVLRDPVKRAYSAYNFFKKLNKEPLSFQEAICREKKERLHSWKEKDDFAYLAHGLYHHQLKNWFNHFDKSQFLIIIYEEFFKSPEKYLPEIFKFLNIEQSYVPNLNKKNVAGEVKYKWINKMIYQEESLLKNFGIQKLIPLKFRGIFLQKLRDYNVKNNGVVKKMTKEEYEGLQEYFDKDVKELSKLINKDLIAFWKY